ncbi:MAG TPA: hypothetical protein VIP70_05150 [Nitrososphaeraceae archaeon]|jgi:hypothetical protein
MDLLFFKRNKKEKENHDDHKNAAVKCKHCDMSFENKERLKVHARKAHTGRGERKKKDQGY